MLRIFYCTSVHDTRKLHCLILYTRDFVVILRIFYMNRRIKSSFIRHRRVCSQSNPRRFEKFPLESHKKKEKTSPKKDSKDFVVNFTNKTK